MLLCNTYIYALIEWKKGKCIKLKFKSDLTRIQLNKKWKNNFIQKKSIPSNNRKLLKR